MEDLAPVSTPADFSAPSTPTKALFLSMDLPEPMAPGTPLHGELLLTPRSQARRLSAGSPRRASAPLTRAIEEPPVKKRRVHGPPLPPRLNALQKPWSTYQKFGTAICFGLAGLHATLHATGAAGELPTPELALATGFWLCWFVTVLASVKFLQSDPRDPGGEEAEVRCRECHMPVRPNSKHCYECMECVVGFDHHCPWLNMCVGSRNYHWYFTLVSGALGVLVFFNCQLAMSGVRLVAAGERRWAGALFLLGHLLGWPLLHAVGDLWLLHCKLIRRGVTTYEYWTRRLPRAPSARRLSSETPLQAREVVSRVSSTGLASRGMGDSLRQASLKLLSGANSLPSHRFSGRVVLGAFADATPPSCGRPRSLASPCGTSSQGYQTSPGWICRTPRSTQCATFDSPAALRGRDVFEAICTESPCGPRKRVSQPSGLTLKTTPEPPRRMPPSFGGM